MAVTVLAISLAFFVSSLIYIALEGSIGQASYENQKIKDRLESLFLRKAKIERSSNFSNIFGLNQALKRQRLSKKLFTLLTFTGWNIPISVFILGDLVWGALVFLIGNLVVKTPLTVLSMTLVAMALPYWFLIMNKRRYVNRFTMVFPDVLMLIKSAIRAGQGVQASFQMVAKEGPQPAAKEFAQMVHEIELGSTVTEALNELYRRIETVELRIFVLGIFIQSEVGGNLVELLEHIEKTVRERLSMLREIRVLSAQGKMTGIVLIMLPFALAGILMMINPKYFDPLINDEGGRKVLIFAGLMQIVGAYFIKKITSFRVA